MKSVNTPQVDARYWTAITLAGVFGANLGDVYPYENGLAIVKRLAFLALLAAIVFAVENFSRLQGEAYYWMVIILILTGASKIADYLAFRVRIPEISLTLGLGGLLYLFGWRRRHASSSEGRASRALPKTDWACWLAMLAAGVLGAIVEDMCSRKLGEGISLLCLAVLLLAALLVARRRTARLDPLYWTTMTIALTAGASIGAWMAHNTLLNSDLSFSALISGLAFLDVLVFWRTHSRKAGA